MEHFFNLVEIDVQGRSAHRNRKEVNHFEDKIPWPRSTQITDGIEQRHIRAPHYWIGHLCVKCGNSHKLNRAGKTVENCGEQDQ